MNGAALRKLSKSGINYMVFRQGSLITAFPTENLLAGWAYDELKSRGTAGRRFEYEVDMAEEAGEILWRVTVDGKTWELGESSLAPIYLNGVANGSTEMLAETRE